MSNVNYTSGCRKSVLPEIQFLEGNIVNRFLVKFSRICKILRVIFSDANDFPTNKRYIQTSTAEKCHQACLLESDCNCFGYDHENKICKIKV